MTRPLPILPGAFYFVTRRTYGRQLRLRPDPYLNGLVEYCMAVAAQRYNVGIVALVVLSNHWHAIIHDREGNHRRWVQWVDSMIARALNHRQKAQDAFWSTLRNPPVLLPDRDALFRKLTYTLTNPAASDLVGHSRQWPGIITLPQGLGTLRPPVKRPTFFFRKDADLPAEARLRLIKPSGLGLRSMTNESFRDTVSELVSQREKEIRRERREQGRRVLDRSAILRQDPFAIPRRRAPLRRIAPRVATRNVTLRVAILKWLRDFVNEHREAFLRFREKRSKVKFPFGTYLLRLQYGVPCRSQPPGFPVPLTI